MYIACDCINFNYSEIVKISKIALSLQVTRLDINLSRFHKLGVMKKAPRFGEWPEAGFKISQFASEKKF